VARDCHRSRRLDVRSQVLTEFPNAHSCALHDKSVYTRITHAPLSLTARRQGRCPVNRRNATGSQQAGRSVVPVVIADPEPEQAVGNFDRR
jgi:hypothetical protein